MVWTNFFGWSAPKAFFQKKIPKSETRRKWAKFGLEGDASNDSPIEASECAIESPALLRLPQCSRFAQVTAKLPQVSALSMASRLALAIVVAQRARIQSCTNGAWRCRPYAGLSSNTVSRQSVQYLKQRGAGGQDKSAFDESTHCKQRLDAQIIPFCTMPHPVHYAFQRSNWILHLLRRSTISPIKSQRG
ncbi:hypothetical protein BC830DRAFT_1159625, partial [Chytriomyces sp. MP71]